MPRPSPVTVVIPAHKAAATLARALDALAFAKPEPTEVIVVLDGPDPAAEAVLDNWPNARVLRLPENRGACAARNAGLEEAGTPYILFLDADDSVSPGLIGSLAQRAEETGADVVLGAHAVETPDGRLRLVQGSRPEKPADLLAFWLSGQFVPPCAVLWRAQFLRQISGWDESLSQNQDGDLMHRAIFAGARVAWARGGYGIYVQGAPNSRVSKAMTASSIASQFLVLERVQAMNAAKPLVSPADIGRAWYNLARRLYGRGADGHGAEALARARAMGFAGHGGALVHRLAAKTFGLDGKTRIIRSLRSVLKYPREGISARPAPNK